MTDTTATDFHQAMLAIYQEAAKVGYRPTRLLQMVSEQGGVETARIILAQNTPTEGFGTLWEKQRLDLAVEALVLRPAFAALFSEEERAKARARLADVNYRAPWDQSDSPPGPQPEAPPGAPSLIERLSRAVSNTQGGGTQDVDEHPVRTPNRVPAATSLYDAAALRRLVARFQQQYSSFADERYRDEERFYKEQASTRMRELLGRERLGALIAQGDFEAAKAAIKQACGGSFRTPTGYRQANNLLNQWDRRSIFDAPAEPLARRLYDLLYGETPFDVRFEAWVALLSVAKPGVWPAATYFLMLHDPEQQIFVKPVVFQSALAALGVDHQWRTRPDAATYALFQQLAYQLRADLAPLAPADLIDVQSFFWSVNAEGAPAWLFAANPGLYDLAGALGELDELRWRIPDFKDEIAPGHLAYVCVSGEQPALAAIARVSAAPLQLENTDIDRRFHLGPPLDAYDTRAIVEVEQIFDPPLALADTEADAELRDVLAFLHTHQAIRSLSAQEADALAALVTAEDDEDVLIEGDPQLAADFAEWRTERTSQHPLVRRALDDYPAWLRRRFGDQIELRFYTRRPEIGVFVDGRWQHFVTFNAVKNGLRVLIDGLQADDLNELDSRLSRPSSLRQREYASKTGFRFFVDTEDDYMLLKDLVTRTIERVIARSKEPPPSPLDGPAFVVIHGQNFGEQELGVAYTFTRNAGGAPVQLLNAVRAWQADGPPVYLLIYRPGPNYTFVGWAQVSAMREGRYRDTDELLYILAYTWHPFPVPVSARALQGVIPWLTRGLRIAFQGKSIRAVTHDDVRAIVERAYPSEITPMTVAHAAYLILTRAGGGPLHLSDILDRIQAEGLAELRGQTPQLSLASILLRDERFTNLGKNTWVLAPTNESDESDTSDAAAVEEPPEPPTRQPAVYAEEEARFWRVHFPRELWERARRLGILAIGWPVDSPNQSVKRFRQIAVGDRVVVYVQGGVIGGLGVVTSSFAPDDPQFGLPLETLDPEYNLYIRIAWADAPAEPVELLDALRHAQYTTLYNRIKNPHTVIPLSRDDYITLLSLLQVDDVGMPRSASRLPNVWPQLAAYLSLARSIGAPGMDAATLQAAARSIELAPAEPLDPDDLVAELLQLRLIAASDATHYHARPAVAGNEQALLRLCALALLVPLEGSPDQYTLPARSILPRLRTTTEAQPAEEFATELGKADSVTLAGWYAEAGLIAVEGASWQPLPGAFDPLPGDDPASVEYNLFLRTLLADIAGELATDLAHVEADAPLPPVEAFEDRLRELGQELLFDHAIIRRIYRSLLAGRHVVLSGPPGTGKTELARLLPALLWREAPETFHRLPLTPDRPPVEQVTEQRDGYAATIVTATEDWGVRDVVGGIGPRLDGQSGALSYTIEHGALTRAVLQHYDQTDAGRRLPPAASGLVRRDHRHEGRRYRGTWLVIDEFTRAPIDAAFGSLLTTLSGSARARLAVPTPAGELREVPLPRDFRIIGTLNSFDRHFLNQMSEAMKRRFDFIDVLPPPLAYADFEQGIAAKEALRRMRDDGFTQIERTGDPPSYRWPGLLRAAPSDEEGDVRRYRWHAEVPEAETAMTSFWRLFSAIRVFRQLGTAQIVAVYLNLLTGVRVGMPWAEALDTALADALADQLQVLSRDEQRTVDAVIAHAGQPAAFASAVTAIVRELPPGRRAGYLYALHERDAATRGEHAMTVHDDTVLNDAQITRVFAVAEPLAIPPMGVFRRRLRDLIGERGL